ncbi:glycosyltransferase family 2 protein [Microbulbifer bruguierae]|uniref:Glycosyltransferase family 2 protein n=1 Tax=Microbulbifer bruguierae TaxID=3029061 RepID=A0ABY8ND71_9GAMM|nr:glycosyltransferase family 2 protein [Microbulbifer bruguierae]WGL16400.1 glycosyltransferase family 2 protein [Microbulbifer bruguierae]
MVELLAESEHSYLDASFTLVREDGRKALNLRLPTRSGRIAKRLIWSARGGEQLLFSPAACAGKYRLKKLSLIRVSAVFALDRMKVRLSRRLLTVPQRMADRWVRYNATFAPNGARVSYRDWMANVEPRLLKIRQFGLGAKPKLSLLIPVGEGDTSQAVTRLLTSLKDQTWSHWRAWLFLPSSLSVADREFLQSFARSDERVQVESVANWLSVLEAEPNNYHLICPPRAQLASRALDTLVRAVQLRPHARVFYSDEDWLHESGRRVDPVFKPAWNPELLFSQNYIGEFVVYSPGVLKSAGTPSFASELAWDLDLLLAVVGSLEDPEAEVAHVPRVLLHRFAAPGSRSYAESSRRVLDSRFKQTGIPGVTLEVPDHADVVKVTWPVPQPEPLVSLLVPTRDKLSVLRLCIDSILEKTTYSNYEILILDNQSEEAETLEYFAQLESVPNVRVLPFNEPFNYSAINNFGARHARGDIIGLINNDVEVISREWLSEMVGHVVRPEVGCVGAKLCYGDGRIQHAGVVVGLGGLAGHIHKFHHRGSTGYMNRLVSTQNFSAVTAACLLVRKKIFEDVGGLNEKDLKVAFNDVDFCLKVGQAGYRNVWTPWAELYHHESISRGIDNTREKRNRFDREARYLREKWVEKLGLDPCYSPFLTYTREDFSLGLNERRDVPLVR